MGTTTVALLAIESRHKLFPQSKWARHGTEGGTGSDRRQGYAGYTTDRDQVAIQGRGPGAAEPSVDWGANRQSSRHMRDVHMQQAET